MAKARTHPPVLGFAAIFSQHVEAMNWACQLASERWGPIGIQSADFDFESTRYYQPTMGSQLKKRLVAFENLIDPTELVSRKLQSNQWEDQLSRQGGYPQPRPVNIDPGYLSEAKVILATMKDRDHRVYLGQGVFAEITLYFQLPGQWVASRWTYADYQLDSYHAFFHDCRKYLRRRLQPRSGQP